VLHAHLHPPSHLPYFLPFLSWSLPLHCVIVLVSVSLLPPVMCAFRPQPEVVNPASLPLSTYCPVNVASNAAAVSASTYNASVAATLNASVGAALKENTCPKTLNLEAVSLAANDDVAVAEAAAARPVDGHFMVVTPAGAPFVLVRGGRVLTCPDLLRRKLGLHYCHYVSDRVQGALDGSANLFLRIHCHHPYQRAFHYDLLLQPYVPRLSSWALVQPTGTIKVLVTEENFVSNAAEVHYALGIKGDAFLRTQPSATVTAGAEVLFLCIDIVTSTFCLPMTLMSLPNLATPATAATPSADV